ncbi:glucose dehydrogenase [FAD, quinone]-like [Periplaneta americana]|uniref:glucose dehydrogenase [FAD, quinone]-like n=1 Tax=Periplaneta americana TaxID=6978 RepID=UPI0037E7EFBC
MDSCSLPEILCVLARLVPLLVNYQTPEDLASPRQLRDGEEYDFIIAGAGPAGCVLANRLSEMKEWKVLLLESGGEEPLVSAIPALTPMIWNSRIDWHYYTQPDPRLCGGKPCFFSTGRGLGGGSLHNNMIYNRGSSLVYDQWGRLGNHGWGYKDVLPYFKKWENNLDYPINNDEKFHGVGGPQSVKRFPYIDKNVYPLYEAFQELGYPSIDINAHFKPGTMILQFFQKNGKRQSSNKAYLKPIRRNRPNLKIVTNVRVTKVIINPKTKMAEGVEYASENNRNLKGKIFARKEVIISCGAINSPQVLMLSGIGPRSTLEPLGIKVIEDLKVGYNFLNHMLSGGLDFVLSNQQSTTESSDQIFADILNYAINHRGPLSGQGIFHVIGVINSGYTNKSDFPDITFNFGPSAGLLNTEASNSLTIPLSYYTRYTPAIINLAPKYVGLISINSSDPFTLPQIYPWYKSHEDNEIFIRGYKFLVNRLSKTKALKDLNISVDITPKELCKNYELFSDKYFNCLAVNYTDFTNHFSGSCKMGPKGDNTAVVSPELKVHNIKNLRVVDTSVTPTLMSGHTNALALMIGEKGADLIQQDWLSKV